MHSTGGLDGVVMAHDLRAALVAITRLS
jgi:hypothetical protein